MPGRDYAADGAYFVTVCTLDRAPVFGQLVDGHTRLNAAGDAVADAWRWLPARYPYVTLDDWCVLPDHLHGILVMGGSGAAPTGDRVETDGDGVETDGDGPARRRKPLGELVGAFKTVSAKNINILRNTPGAGVWQRDFWDHVIRDDADLHRVRTYIRNNQGCRGGS